MLSLSWVVEHLTLRMEEMKLERRTTRVRTGSNEVHCIERDIWIDIGIVFMNVREQLYAESTSNT